MGVYEIYSKRKRSQEKAGQPDVYRYDDIPLTLRTQVVHIWDDAIGPYDYGHKDVEPSVVWELIHSILCREYGVFTLGRQDDSPYENCRYLLLKEADIDRVLSLIEVSFRCIDRVCREYDHMVKHRAPIKQEPDKAIDELNIRFKEHEIGYQYASGEIIRVDSQYIHAEVTLPAISLLRQVGFDGASEEFLNAHKHYRNGRNKEAIAEALKAFESAMKTICSSMGWEVQENATAKPLIDACFSNGLISQYTTGHFSALRATLESGLPTVSNKLARHGQGRKRIIIPDHYAAYALHLAATNIIFLVESYGKIKK